MELTPAELEFLRIVAEVEKSDGHAGTKAVAERLEALRVERGEADLGDEGQPYFGTSVFVDELRTARLLDVDPGIAVPTTFGGAATVPEEYWLLLTEAGRQSIA